MRFALVLLLLAACGAPAPVVLGSDGGVIATCDIEWCTLDDGGRIGAP
jgi:hypothetical protein